MKSRPTFALLQRAITEESRSVSSYMWRMLMLGLLYFLLYQASANSFQVGAHGRYVFGLVVFCAVWTLTLLGVGVMASAISEEKQEGTLGLLRMTRLGPMNILLGKSLGMLLTVLQLLMVLFPLTLLTLPLGGVSSKQLLQSAIALLAYTVMLMGMSLLASTICRTTRKANTAMVLALLACFWGPQVAASIGGVVTLPPSLSNALYFVQQCSVFFRLNVVNQLGFGGVWLDWQLFSNVAIGVTCFLLAWAVFERISLDSEATTGRGGRFDSLWGWKRYRDQPIIQKDFRYVAGGWLAVAIRFACYWGLVAIFAGMIAGVTQVSFNQGVNIAIAVYFFGWVLEVAMGLSRTFAKEIRERTFSTLGQLPTPILTTAYHKVIGVFVATLPTFLVLALLAIISDDVLHELGRMFENNFEVLFLFLSFGVAYAHLLVLFSLYMKRAALAAATGTMIVTMLLMVFTLSQARSGEEEACGVFGMLYLAASVAAHAKCRARIRELVAD